MKKIKYFLIMLVCIAISAVLYGCQNVRTMTIDTKLVINSNFDGERTMTASLDKNTLNAMFDGDVSKLQTMIENYCPVEMSCRAQASDDGGAVVAM